MAKEQRILFIRHGETVGNLEQIAHGQTESPLNDRGIAQAHATGEEISGWDCRFDKIYTSPLSRARDTGSIINEKLGIPFEVVEGLIEGFLGILENATYQELEEFGFGRESVRNDDFSGHKGESPNQLGDRIFRTVEGLRKSHPKENLIIVSHGAAIAHYMAKALQTKPAFGHQYLMHNAGITELSFDGINLPELVLLNQYKHMPVELQSDPLRRDQHVPE